MVMEYDGRYRLGCNGTLFIFLEPVQPLTAELLWQSYQHAYQHRHSFTIATTYRGPISSQGSRLVFSQQNFYCLSGQTMSSESRQEANEKSLLPTERDSRIPQVFVQTITAAPRLYVIGSEQDAIALAQMATLLGWHVILVTHPRHPVDAQGLLIKSVAPEHLSPHLTSDERTAIVLMTHSYSRDLAYLTSLFRLETPAYLGLIGPQQRRENLLSEVSDRTGELPAWLDERLYAPAGIDLGAELPAEIALSVLAEIKAVLAGRAVSSLRDKRTAIHQPTTSLA